jgi:hypothetical protein
MSFLTKLKFVSAKKPTMFDPIVMRRNKLVAKIDEQIALANAIDAGSSYAPTRTKLVANSTTGLKERVAVQKRVKEWFWRANSDKLVLSIRYGARTLELAKGKNAIEVASYAEVAAALKLVRNAVELGELDDALFAAGQSLKAGFKKH